MQQKGIHAMTAAHCIECDEEVELEGRIRVGQQVVCAHCGVELEVISLSPLELDWAREEVEDDDAWEDDEEFDDFDEFKDEEDESDLEDYEEDDLEDLDDFDDDEDDNDHDNTRWN